MAPRSAAAVVKAHATSAKAFAELKRARSEALLRALHNLENDTRSSAVLVQIQDLRQRLGSRLETYCAEHGIARPKPNTEEEASLLLLLNAQLIALDDAQDEIARRSAELSREKVRAAQETARANLEANVLPERLQNKVATNPVRERILCEDMRHHSATWVARLMGTLGGALTGFMTATTDVLVSSIAETAAVTGPPLVVLLLTLVTQTVAHHGPLTFGIVSGFLGAALWNALLILGITLTGYAVWRFLDKRARNLREHRVREGAARGYAARGYAARSQAAQPGASPYDPRWASGAADVGAPAQAQRPKTRSVRDYAIDALGLDARP